VNIIIIIISEIELEIEHGMNFRDEMLRENMNRVGKFGTDLCLFFPFGNVTTIRSEIGE
jgi:hypothetical protein